MKRILNAKPAGRKKRVRPKLRWEDGVDTDVKARVGGREETGKTYPGIE
jgi:hypothetical protein